MAMSDQSLGNGNKSIQKVYHSGKNTERPCLGDTGMGSSNCSFIQLALEVRVNF
jgi:hypothetical protein